MIPGSEDEALVKARLNPAQEKDKLKPFIIMPAALFGKRVLPQVTLYLPDKENKLPRVQAEMQIWPLGHCFHTYMCRYGNDGGVCPITKMPFETGDSVYVLRGDVERARKRYPVKL